MIYNWFSQLCTVTSIQASVPCYQRGTTSCDTGLMVAACSALNMTLPSGGSLPQSCSAALMNA